MGQFTLAVQCPNQRDATSLYRGVGPLSVLRRQIPDLRLAFLPPQIDWSHLSMIDALFSQRPFRDEDVKLIQMARRMHIPVWVDFDDDLFRVPSWNPTASVYNNRHIQENVGEAINSANVVSVSTEHLARSVGALNNNVVVIPNAWDDFLFPRHPRGDRQGDPREFLVMWRGSPTHRKDLNVCADACIEMAKLFPFVTWFFLGDAPWFADYMPEHAVRVAAGIDPMEYHALIAKLNPNIWIVPLDDCEFNKSKSNCSWLEGSWAGAATLAPNWPEWAKPGIVNYRDGKDFAVKLRHMLESKSTALDECAEKSWQYVSENLMLSRVNEKRKAILEGLANDRSRSADFI